MCPFRVNKRCSSALLFHQHCGIVRKLSCSARHEYERAMEEKRALIEAEQREVKMMLGIGA
jgi:hypothetical protein